MTAFDIEKRKRLLIECGNDVAEELSLSVQQNDGTVASIKFNDSALNIENIVARYFERVKTFKIQNNFKDGEKINCSKIAAIWGINILDHGAENLFRCDRKFERSAYTKLTAPLLVYRSAINIMELDIEKIQDDIENDFVRCLGRYPEWMISIEWLSWSLEVFRQHYSQPDPERPAVCKISS